jgi:error-prone DNA polymerase
VTLRQRPQTASGVTFLTLEDEDGLVNVVVWRQVADEAAAAVAGVAIACGEGRLESKDGVQHLIARRLSNLSTLLGPLSPASRDFQ